MSNNSKSKPDFCVVGAGCYGAVFARIAAENGNRVLLIDQRNHVGGNAYTMQVNADNGAEYDIHLYGAHIFHSNDAKLVKWVETLQDWRTYSHTLIARCGFKDYSFPINLRTFEQVFGARDQIEAMKILESVQVKCDAPSNAEQFLHARIGKVLTEMFYRGYSAKHWGCDLSELPVSIVKRVPIRLAHDECYFRHRFQMLPLAGGYTKMFINMLDHPMIDVELEKHVTLDEAKSLAKHVVFTGPIDKAMGYSKGRLPSRALRFELKTKCTSTDPSSFSGKSVVNLCSLDTPYTRIIDHAAFAIPSDMALPAKRIFTYESAMTAEEARELDVDPMYPIRTDENVSVYESYKGAAKPESKWLTFGGRCGTYKYLDMDAAMQQAVTSAKRKFGMNTDFIGAWSVGNA